MLRIFFRYPMAELRDWRRDLQFWLMCNPLREPDKKGRKEINKEVNSLMKPLLKQMGLRSVAELERRYEDEQQEARELLNHCT